MKKEGQLTIFVIISIFIIGAALLFFILRGNVSPPENSGETNQVKSNVDSCIEDMFNQGAAFISSRGGYYNLPDDYFQSFPLAVPYWISNCKDSSPKNTTILNELSKYLDSQIGYCLEKTNITGERVNYGNRKSEIIPYGNRFRVNLAMPTSVTRGNSSFYMESYELTVDNKDFFTALNLSKNLISYINRDDINFLGIIMLSDKENFDVFLDYHDTNIYIATLKSRENPDFTFNFAADLKC